MRYSDVLRISFSTFVNNKMRTLLTVLGVSIGISMTILLVSIGYGLQQVTIGEVRTIKALTTFDVTTGNSSILALDKAAIETIRSIPNVASVSTLLSMSGQISFEGRSTDVLVNDASAEYVDLTSPKLAAGESLSSDDAPKALITTVITSALNVKPADIVGQTIKLIFYVPTDASGKQLTELIKEYTVAGVVSDDAASYAFIPSGTVELPTGVNYAALKVKVKDSGSMAGVKTRLTQMGYTTSSIGETITQIDRVFRVAQVILLIFGAIAMVIASIGMFNTLTISLLERTKDIGIMKSLGAKDRSIYSVFLTESTIISFMGGIVGTIAAFIIGQVINIFVSYLARRAGGESVALFQPPFLFIGGIFLFTILVGVFTGLYPARRAAKIDPLDALRYE